MQKLTRLSVIQIWALFFLVSMSMISTNPIHFLSDGYDNIIQPRESSCAFVSISPTGTTTRNYGSSAIQYKFVAYNEFYMSGPYTVRLKSPNEAEKTVKSGTGSMKYDPYIDGYKYTFYYITSAYLIPGLHYIYATYDTTQSPIAYIQVNIVTPTNFALSGGESPCLDDTVTFTWTKSAGATNYRLYEASSSEGSYSEVKTVGDLARMTYTQTPTFEITRYYKLSAYTTVEESPLTSSCITVIWKPHVVYEQDFEGETIGTWPEGWDVYYGNMPYSVAYVQQGPRHGYDIFPTQYLALYDPFQDDRVKMCRLLATPVSQGSFEFDYWNYGGTNFRGRHYITLAETVYDNLITIEFDSSPDTDMWWFKVQNTLAGYYPINAPAPWHIQISFINSQVDVFINGVEILSNLPYSGIPIEYICIYTASTTTYGDWEAWMDNFHLYNFIYPIYYQNFDAEPLLAYPEGWTVVSGSYDPYDDCDAIIHQGTLNSNPVPFTTRFLGVRDRNPDMHVDIYRPLSTSVFDGKFEFDSYLFNFWYVGFHQMILEDAAGNDVISIVFDSYKGDPWHLYVNGVQGPNFFSQTIDHFQFTFINSQIDVVWNGVEVLSDIPYSGTAIEQIRFFTSNANDGMVQAVDYFLITKFSYF